MPCNNSGEDAVTVAQLDEFARTQWEGVLGYMVGSTGINLGGGNANLSPSVKHLLRYGGLVEVRGINVDITQTGFAFVLQEVNAQVWTILILYLENAEQVRGLPFLRFIGHIRDANNSDINSLAWIVSTSCPFFSCSAALNSAKTTVKPI